MNKKEKELRVLLNDFMRVKTKKEVKGLSCLKTCRYCKEDYKKIGKEDIFYFNNHLYDLKGFREQIILEIKGVLL